MTNFREFGVYNTEIALSDLLSVIEPVLRGVSLALQQTRWAEADDPQIKGRWKAILLRLESTRLDVLAARPFGNELNSGPMFPRRARAFEAVQQVALLFRTLQSDYRLMRDADYISVAAKVPTPFARKYPRNASLDQVIITTLKLISSCRSTSEISKDPVADLRRLIPEQKISPVQFFVRAGKLAVVRQAATTEAEDVNNIRTSRDTLLSKGNQLVEELRRSNCDRRLLQGVTELQQSLSSCDNIIQLGLMNIGVEEIGKAFEAELPDVLRGMLLGHTRGIAMYVAQFPEWQRFSEKAASVEFTVEDIERISQTAERLVADFEQHPEIADEEVPKTIKALQQLISDPQLAAKRAAFAVLRTIENLVAKVFEYCTNFLEKTTEKTIERLSTAASRTIVVTLMTVALACAVGISPLGAKIAETAWIKSAAEIVQNEIEALAK